MTKRSDHAATDWRQHLITTADEIGRVIDETKRIAVIGIKPDPDQPAHYVPEYALAAGFDVVPVPVYYPEMTEVLGQRVYRALADVPGDVDMVNIFRRSNDVPIHIDDILAKHPKSVWMQLGIRNDDAAEQFARAGIDVVQDHCLMVELKRRRR